MAPRVASVGQARRPIEALALLALMRVTTRSRKESPHPRLPTGRREKLPKPPQPKVVLERCQARETAVSWLAIGCGFGPRGLAAIRVGQVNRENDDLRRGKTGFERHGDTPLLVWNGVHAYLKTAERKDGDPSVQPPGLLEA